MTTRRETGYETELVFAFLDAMGERGSGGRFQSIHGIPVWDGHRHMLDRWEHWVQVPLRKLDPLLMGYDLSITEFEDWAIDTYGRDGYSDYLQPTCAKR